MCDEVVWADESRVGPDGVTSQSAADLLGYFLFVIQQPGGPVWWSVSLATVSQASKEMEAGATMGDAKAEAVRAVEDLVSRHSLIRQRAARDAETISNLRRQLAKARRGCRRLRIERDAIAGRRPDPLDASPNLIEALLDFSKAVQAFRRPDLAERQVARDQALQLHAAVDALLDKDDPRRSSVDHLRNLLDLPPIPGLATPGAAEEGRE